MSEDMVKKSVDITQEDEEWLEDSYLNFSKFVRRKIAERRAEGIRDHKKERLYNQLVSMVDKGEELRAEWSQEKEELKEKYDAEVVERDTYYWRFKMNGSEWSTDWMAEEIHDADANNPGEDVKEFAKKYTSKWQDKIADFNEFVSKETYFVPRDGDEYSQNYEGEGMLDRFSLRARYVPTDIESFTVKFESRVDLDLEDLERAA